MDGIIEVKVNGYSISKDSTCAGAQYEENSTMLRVTFCGNWYHLTKKITFWNAKGENPVRIVFTSNLLVGMTEDTCTYLVPIPGEAMTEAGKLTFVIDGYIDGIRKGTVEDKLSVLPSRRDDAAGQAQEPTPTQTEQLQTQIDSILEDIYKASNAADEAKEYAEKAEAAIDKSSYIGEDNYWYVWDSEAEAYENTGVLAEGKTSVYVGAEEPKDPDIQVWIDPTGGYVDYAELCEDFYALRDATEGIKSDVEGIQQQINEEAHFRGYVPTNAKVMSMEATPNDFAYSAESGTKWVYDAEKGWQDTGSLVPDQLTPASDATPLVNGVATAGQANEYARGDHRHPTDTSRASAEEVSLLKDEIKAALDGIIAIQNALIGG